MNYNQELQRNVRDVNRKKKAEIKITDLQNQLKYLRGREQKHKAILEQHQADIDKLQGRTLYSLFMAGSKRKKLLDKERREVYEATIDYNSIVSQIKAVEKDLEEEKKILASLEGSEARYEKGLNEYRKNFSMLQKEKANEIVEIESKIAQYVSHKKEIEEAIEACRDAKQKADVAYMKLQKSKHHGIFDSLNRNRDAAQDQIKNLLISVRRFKNELGDVQDFMQNAPIKTERFLKFADYFFDDIFLESKEEIDLQVAVNQVEQIRWKLEEADEALTKMLSQTEQKEQILKNKIDNLVVDSLI